MFNEVLGEISKLSRAIVFLDECEGIFRSRGPMMNYASVSVTAKVDVIDDFLAWVDGLETARGKKMQLGLRLDFLYDMLTIFCSMLNFCREIQP